MEGFEDSNRFRVHEFRLSFKKNRALRFTAASFFPGVLECRDVYDAYTECLYRYMTTDLAAARLECSHFNVVVLDGSPYRSVAGDAPAAFLVSEYFCRWLESRKFLKFAPVRAVRVTEIGSDFFLAHACLSDDRRWVFSGAPVKRRLLRTRAGPWVLPVLLLPCDCKRKSHECFVHEDYYLGNGRTLWKILMEADDCLEQILFAKPLGPPDDKEEKEKERKPQDKLFIAVASN